MKSSGILTDEFYQQAVAAVVRARRNALAGGHSVVFRDETGRYLEELPDGKRYEVRFRPGAPREAHLEVVGELQEGVKVAGLKHASLYIDALLRTAIQQKRVLQLLYRDKLRIVEPHDYGIHNGSVKLLAFQIGGKSSGRLPNWRWMEVDSISEIQPLERTFPGGRAIPSGKHHQWDELFARVAPAEKRI